MPGGGEGVDEKGGTGTLGKRKGHQGMNRQQRRRAAGISKDEEG